MEESDSYKILIIDDNKFFVKQLTGDAATKNLTLVHETNLDDAVDLIEKNPQDYFSGIILDGKGFITRDQTVATIDFIPAAIGADGKLNRGKASYLDKIILSGVRDVIEYYGKFTKFSYRKGDEEEEALNKIKELAVDLPSNIIRKQHRQVFSIFEKGFLDREVETKLISLIRDMAKEDPKSVENNLTTLRNLQEEIYKAINKKFGEKIIPTRFMSSHGFEGLPNVPGIFKYLSNAQKEYTSLEFVKKWSIMHQFAKINWDIASGYGDHTYERGPNIYEPTQYTVQVCTNAMLDLLLWFKSVMEERQ